MSAVLSTHGLIARYGDFQALYGVDVELHAGEAVALIGANGAGKSTFLRAVMGLLPVGRDMVRLDGEPVGGTSADRMVKRGVAIVPEGRRLFTGMSVDDNLKVAIDQAARLGAKGGWSLERLHRLFPILKEKAKTPVQSLSGGQQQMVAIGRALLCQPRVLLCDEISLGLAPKVIREIYAALPEIRGAGTAMILVEQDVGLAKEATDRLYCMLEGRVTLSGRSAEVTREAIGEAYFGAGHAVV
ncbi:ABC transporter ATP-binding protein [Kaistia geumhonensis]|uniref:Branched-chain amino acid transport system ATP-binding protein n=1 Tax=Kaistia geumhonensis TaxID=410839 RepID=A0ABU0M5J6_9HYPH|nr:ABC transporter ATP-binding protein [Kaistia geumhonensis]MCX5478709.1 ABC transporter ATP-binding protein [Kaistia geumhonensis]MDQ0516073.1 branched-chain amino acid transport system ATP-binding protein [Kaistia geumhonensis]